MINLRDFLKNTITLYLKNFPTVFKVIFWFLLFNLILILFISPPQPPYTTKWLILMSSLTAFSLLLGAWTDQMLTSVLYGFLKSQPVNLKEKTKETLKRLPAYVLVLVLWTILTGFGLIFLIFPGLIFLTWYLFISPVFVVEGTGVWRAFQRSRSLVHGFGIQLFGRFFVLGLLIFLFFLILSQLAYFFFVSIIPQNYLAIILSIASLLFSRLLGPLLSSGIVILYDEARRIKEAR